MANKKSSPVKPPIIDLKANKNQKTTSGDKAKAEKPNKKSDKPTKSPSIIFPALLGTIGGAILGVVITYLLAFSDLLPTPKKPEANIAINQEISNNQSMIANLQQQISSFTDKSNSSENALVALSNQLETIEKTTNTNIKTTQNIADENNQSISEITKNINILQSELQTQANQFSNTDLNKIDKQIEIFEEKLNALAVGASSEEATQIAASLSDLRNNEKNLLAQINLIKTDLDNNGSNIAELENKLNQLSEQIAQTKLETNLIKIDPSNQPLSLAISKFENAIYNGESFNKPLDAIKTALPTIILPQNLEKLAISGLDNPDNIIVEFSNLVPTILRATPSNKDANWRQSLLERSMSILAIRPKGEVAGDSPAQIVARIEASLSNKDFISANELINQLPNKMQTATAQTGKKIADFSLAQTFEQNINDIILEQNSNNNGETTQ